MAEESVKLVQRTAAGGTSASFKDLLVKTDWSLVGSKPLTFPPDGHQHAASDITSGTLAVARGGTGLTTSTGRGYLLVGDPDGAWTVLAPATGKYLYAGSGGNLSWQDPPSGGVSVSGNNTWTGTNRFNNIQLGHQGLPVWNGDKDDWDTFIFPSSYAGVLATQNWVNSVLPSGGGGNLPIIYGYCSTAIGTAAKVVSATSSANAFTDYIKDQIYVIEFSAGNTATSPTININSKGAKTIYHLTTNGGATSSPGTDIFFGRSRMIVTFVYNGTYMIPIGVSTRHANALETKMLAYTKASSALAITTSDTVSSAIGKLEYKIDNAGGGGSSGGTEIDVLVDSVSSKIEPGSPPFFIFGGQIEWLDYAYLILYIHSDLKNHIMFHGKPVSTNIGVLTWLADSIFVGGGAPANSYHTLTLYGVKGTLNYL